MSKNVSLMLGGVKSVSVFVHRTMKKYAFPFFIAILIFISLACGGPSGAITNKEIKTAQVQTSVCVDVNGVPVCQWQTSTIYILYVGSNDVRVSEREYTACDVGEAYPACANG